MSNLIALVATAVMVNGERTIIQPGEPLPDLGEHDHLALLDSGAASDPARDRRAARDQAKAEQAAQAEFEATRERIQAEAASTAPPPAPPAGKTAKKS